MIKSYLRISFGDRKYLGICLFFRLLKKQKLRTSHVIVWHLCMIKYINNVISIVLLYVFKK